MSSIPFHDDTFSNKVDHLFPSAGDEGWYIACCSEPFLPSLPSEPSTLLAAQPAPDFISLTSSLTDTYSYFTTDDQAGYTLIDCQRWCDGFTSTVASPITGPPQTQPTVPVTTESTKKRELRVQTLQGRTQSQEWPTLRVASDEGGSHPHSPRRNVYKYRCPILLCPKAFDRSDRAEACHNRHLQSKPYACYGACGNSTCSVAYGSRENFRRHTRAPNERNTPCPHCEKDFLKQNIARHKTNCKMNREAQERNVPRKNA